MKNLLLPLLGATLFAATAPSLFSGSEPPNSSTVNFPGWPKHFEDKPLKALDLTEKERWFARDFPGEIGRFTDGSREIIIRWVESPTRRLHPAADCFTGVGYEISPLPVQHSPASVPMGCFMATKGDQVLRVCEYVTETTPTNGSKTWSDVSSWYWQTVFSDATHAWWSVVVAENSAISQPRDIRK